MTRILDNKSRSTYMANTLANDLNASAIQEITRHLEYCLKLDKTYHGYSNAERETIEQAMKSLNTILSWKA